MAYRTTCSVKLILRPSRNGELDTVNIRVRYDQKRRAWALSDLHVSKQDFDKIQKTGKRFSPELNDIRLRMSKYLADAEKIVSDLGPDFTFDKFADLFFGKKEILSKQTKFSDIVDEYIFANQLSINTKNGYRTMLNTINRLYPTLTIGGINPDIVKAFRSHLNDRASVSTANIYLRYMKAVWNFAASNGWINGTNSPFKGIKLSSMLQKKRALNEEQIRMLKNYSTEIPEIRKAIDFFLISFYCNGISFKDLLNLKSSNFKGNFIEFRRSKTRRTISRNKLPVTAALHPSLSELLNKWAKIEEAKDDYIFPFISEGITEEKRQRIVDQFIQNTNKRLAVVGKELGLPIKLTTYVARHSFASVVAKQIDNPYFVKDLLGHSTFQQTETYISSLDTSASTAAAAIVAGI